jgi:hypothetical protein
MIGEPGHWRSGLAGPAKEDTTMLKTISAALLGVAILAAPALAATPAKSTARTTQAPVAKTTAQKTIAQKTTQAPVIKGDQAKSKVMNANAKMHRHHARHHRTHRHHTMSAMKMQHTPKVAIKHVTPATPAKRG